MSLVLFVPCFFSSIPNKSFSDGSISQFKRQVLRWCIGWILQQSPIYRKDIDCLLFAFENYGSQIIKLNFDWQSLAGVIID